MLRHLTGTSPSTCLFANSAIMWFTGLCQLMVIIAPPWVLTLGAALLERASTAGVAVRNDG